MFFLKFGQEAADGFAQHGMDEVRRYLGQGTEHEVPLRYAGVRQGEPGAVHFEVLVEQQVQVQSPGAPVELPLAQGGLLQLLQLVQQLQRGQQRVQRQAAVQKARLPGSAARPRTAPSR